MARIDEKVGLSKNRQDQSHPPLKMKLPSRVERKCGEWCEVQSKTKKKIYYLNIRTKETTWKKPPGWCDKTADKIGGLKKSFKESPSLSTDSSSQEAPVQAPTSCTHHRPKQSPKHSQSHRSETPKHRRSSKHSSSRKRSPPRMNSSLNSSSSISTSSTTDSSIPSSPKSTTTRLPAPIPPSVLFDPLKNAEKDEKAREERDQEIDKIYSSKILKIQQLERRNNLMSKLKPQNCFPENAKILRQHQHLVCESIPSRIQELVYNKKEKQADFYARENSRNEQKTSECSGEIMRLKHKLRSRSFLINSVDGFCSLQRQRAEALMLSSFPNFDSPERPTG
ncbi:unnamed protein product [Oikopleura dioica]|uniref:WW domain-containing protein n=1 Tax=Oikopleura dioica TaxID=34765 RepID=E4XQX1_OIKDI|nr:unnamed protein product [Oikopleura dioica]